MSWIPSCDNNTLFLAYPLRAFCLLKGLCGAERRGWHRGLSIQVSEHLDMHNFLQSHIVAVKGEATTLPMPAMDKGSHRFFVLYRSNNKIHLRHDHSQAFWQPKLTYPFLRERVGENNLKWSKLLCSIEKILPCNDLSRE